VPGLLLSFTSSLMQFAPPQLSLPALCLLLFVDNATLAVASSALLLTYARHFSPWQVGLFGAIAAGLGSTLQLVVFRMILASDWAPLRRFAPSRERVAQALATAPSTLFIALLLARATPLPDAPLKLVAAAGRYPLPLYFLAVFLGGAPYYALLAWFGHEFPLPPWVLLVLVVVIAGVFLFERWRTRGRTPRT
jgi:uncharacterized membrane protein YdjX (TVP38/TMEM64 family)